MEYALSSAYLHKCAFIHFKYAKFNSCSCIHSHISKVHVTEFMIRKEKKIGNGIIFIFTTIDFCAFLTKNISECTIKYKGLNLSGDSSGGILYMVN